MARGSIGWSMVESTRGLKGLGSAGSLGSAHLSSARILALDSSSSAIAAALARRSSARLVLRC